MLRVVVSRSAHAAKKYHRQSLSREDYYSAAQEIRGEWNGAGAMKLGLSGPVTQETFDALCENKKPGTDERLTCRNNDNRRVGYDFNFHCPKSVSVVYEFTQDERIINAFRLSVKQTMREIESETKTYIRKNGATGTRTTGNLIWAEFVHFTARPVKGVPDPHLHAHCFVFNATWDEPEKQWKAGEFRDLKANAPYFEAAFHARLARQLADIGYQIKRTANGWELAGVPDRVLQEFSKRSEQVEKKADELGVTTARGKDGLAALTRERKRKDVSKADLRELWGQRISADEQLAIRGTAWKSASLQPRISATKAMDFAMGHCFERASIVTDKELLRQALRHGVGDVDVESVKQQLARDDFIKEQAGGENWFTTKEVVAEERRLIDFVQTGHSKFKPFRESHTFRNPELSVEQRNAVLHVLKSRDRVTAIRGGAGTGKTTMMKEAVAAIEQTGLRVFTFAPSAEAARGVLRREAGFGEAETVEMLLQNSTLQQKIRGQVVWIDEAGMLSARMLARIADLADRTGCRVILSGDSAQHRAVERGDALRILENHAGLKSVELKEIRRQQKEEYKALVALLRAGDTRGAFSRMEELGILREVPSENRHQQLAADYLTATRNGKSALVISPTHAEGEQVTAEIRGQLRVAHRIGATEHNFLRLKNLQWTEAERKDGHRYMPNLIIQFHQNVPGFRRGEQVTVKDRTRADEITIERSNGQIAALPLKYAARFQVYESREIALAAGDWIRITQNGFTQECHRLNNGDLKRIKGFTEAGEIKLDNGWTLAREYGNIAHGYCLTSYSSQSKGVDCVFISEGSESFRAASREQFYVSASRFKESLAIYTDDKQALLEAVGVSSHRPAAIDLIEKETQWPISKGLESLPKNQVGNACQNRNRYIVKPNEPAKAFGITR